MENQKFHLVLILLLARVAYLTKASEDDPQNICDLPGVPMYCNCDEIYVDEATMVSCYMSTNMTVDDHHWSGFGRQKNIESLVFISRETLYLTYVPSEVIKGLPKLHHFGLAEAQLGSLPAMAFAECGALRTINAERNGISKLENRAFYHLPSLLKLTMSDNKISEVPSEVFYDLPKLEELYLEHNEIHKIHDGAFAQLHALKELDLFNNQLKHLNPKSLSGLKSLRRLDVSRNRLSTLKDHVFRGTPQLRNLDLSHNRLSSISDRAFDHLTHLVNLRMKENRLGHLPDTIFRGCPNLISLAVTGNHLHTLQDSVVESLNNRTDPNFAIYLKDNKFECRCDMLWVKEFAKSTVHTFFKTELSTIECSMPDDAEVKVQIATLTEEQLKCSDQKVHQHTVPSHHHEAVTTTNTMDASTKGLPITKPVEHKEVNDVEEYHDDDVVADPPTEEKMSEQPKNIELQGRKEDTRDVEEKSSKTMSSKSTPEKKGSNGGSTFESSLFSQFILVSFIILAS